MTFLLDMVKLGLGNLLRHKLRSFLTGAGDHLRRGGGDHDGGDRRGLEQQALARIEQLGARNIIIRSQRPPESQQMGGGQQRGRSMRYGLTRDDLAVIRANFADAGGDRAAEGGGIADPA